MPITTKAGSTAADFSETGIDRQFSERDFGGLMRANESMLAAIEKSVEWALWKRSLLDSHGTCRVAVAGGSFQRGDGIAWNADFAVMKGSTKTGSGSVKAAFDSRPKNVIVLRDVHVKVYADQRERIGRACGER